MEKTVHFANLMDLCHLKNAELAKHLQKFTGERVVLQRGTTSKTKKDTERYSQSNVLQRLGKFLGHHLKACGYGWRDAISAYIQVKMTEAPRWLPMPNKECPENVDHNSPRQRPEGCDKVILEKGWEEVPTLECPYAHKMLVLFLSVFVDDVKNGWKETKHGLCGKLDKKKSTLKIQRG